MLDGSGAGGHGASPWPGLAPGTEVAGFIIEGLLATGSFGTVYRARRGGRLFAIKLVSMAPRSNREVDALRRMQHPNVVGFHGYGLWPDEQPHSIVLALELVEGRPLDVWAQEVNPTALELVGRVLLPLALTLADVHAAGVVHRDVKEANILVRDSDGLPVLVDFGSAGIEGAPRLTQWMPPGTPEYRSPETLRRAREWEGEPYTVGPAEDLWALGIVTYILLTRTLPFGDRSDPGMVRAILETTPRAPEELNPRVPPALSELCMRMLEKHPEDRYADARALAEALSEEWTQADRSWRVPLFPEAAREESPAPPPMTPEESPAPPPAPVAVAVSEKQTPGQWRMTRLVLAAAVLGGMATPFVQRTESPPTALPQKVSARQELAPAQVTAEVGNGAGPQKSPTPAPVASATSSEEPKMMKSQKVRSLAATTLMAGAACTGAGCVSTPDYRAPPDEQCPPEALKALEQLEIKLGYSIPIRLPPVDKVPKHGAAVSEKDVTATLVANLGKLPRLTPLYGKLYFSKNLIQGRFTRARLPSGEVVPVCMQMISVKGFGILIEPGSTPEKALDSTSVHVMAMPGFNSDWRP